MTDLSEDSQALKMMSYRTDMNKIEDLECNSKLSFFNLFDNERMTQPDGYGLLKVQFLSLREQAHEVFGRQHSRLE